MLKEEDGKKKKCRMSKDVFGYKPFPYQKAMHDLIDQHPSNSIFCLKAKRQCGKSLLIENELLKNSINYPDQESICISPTYKQGSKIFRDLVRACTGTPVLTGANGSDLLMTFYNGSTIRILSAESRNNIRGFTVTKHGMLCVDECAYVSDEVFYAALPFVDANQANVLCVSTPLFKSGFFYELYEQGMGGKDGIYVVDVNDYDTSALLSPERLEFYRQTLPPNIFRTEYLGEWMDLNSSVFGNFEPCISRLIPTDTNNCVMGVDWATGSGNDETAISVFNDKQQMVFLSHFNDRDATDTINAICDVIGRYNPVKCVIELNSIGKVYYDLLVREVRKRRLKTIVVPFTTTNESKRDIIESLQMQMLHRNVQLLDEPTLKLEFAAFELQRTPSGKITYNNSSDTIHDDIVMSVALALSGNTQGSYLVR